MPQIPGLIKYTPAANVNNPQGSDEIIFQDSVSKAFYAKNAAGVLVPIGNFLTGIAGNIPTPPQGYNIIWQSTSGAGGYVLNGYYSRNYLGVDTLISSNASPVVTPGTPTVVAGTAAGTSPTISIAGNDLAGLISVLTGGGSPTTNNAIATITLGAIVFPTSTVPVISMVNEEAAGVIIVAVPISNKSWALYSSGVALATTTGYQWAYIISGY